MLGHARPDTDGIAIEFVAGLVPLSARGADGSFKVQPFGKAMGKRHCARIHLERLDIHIGHWRTGVVMTIIKIKAHSAVGILYADACLTLFKIRRRWSDRAGGGCH